MDPRIVERALRDLRHDLDDGAWGARHREPRTLDSYDAELRLIVNT